MLGVKQLIMLGILIFLILVGITWIYFTIRSIRLQKRISRFMVATQNSKPKSITDQLIYEYQKLRNQISLKLQKKKKYSKDLEMITIEKNNFLATQILFSVFFLISYLLLSLLSVFPFHILLAIVSFLLGFYLPNIMKLFQDKKNIKEIEKDLLKAISLMNHSFASGKSIMQVVEIVSQELEGPVALEFAKIHQDMLHGLSFQTAFERFSERVKLEEVNYITTALTMLNKTGGDVVTVFSFIEKNLYRRRSLELEWKSTVASSRLVFQLLVFLPLFLLIGISIWNPNYFATFFSSTLGLLLFIVILCIYILYIVVIKSIMKIEKY